MSADREVFVVAAKRTPIGRFLGSFAGLHPTDLGASAVTGALGAAGATAEQVEQVYFGHARQAGNGPNVARQVGMAAGIPEAVPAVTINMACASGLESIALGARAIRAGDVDVAVAGGTENMSRVPYLIDDARTGHKLGTTELVDAMYRDGFACRICNQLMGETAETLARDYEIGRDEQDRFALTSQERAGAAMEAGRFGDEIEPVDVTVRRETRTIDTDEHPRPSSTLAGLAKLPPVFDAQGTVTAGNACGIVDGAAALVLASGAAVERHGWTPLARFVGSEAVGVDPARMGIGPVPAVRKLLGKHDLELADVDLVELNEAFAAQVLACDRELAFDHERLNVNGGAIALGHPIGATGARIVVTLLHALRQRDVARGLATLCVSGGQGMAALFERN